MTLEQFNRLVNALKNIPGVLKITGSNYQKLLVMLEIEESQFKQVKNSFLIQYSASPHWASENDWTCIAVIPLLNGANVLEKFYVKVKKVNQYARSY